MRKHTQQSISKFRIAVLDDEVGIIDALSVILRRNGYDFMGFTDPSEAINAIRTEHFDMLILDYLMGKVRGDEVVKKIREFNKGLYILLLTGHKDIAPPFETIRALDIQGYCEKSNKFDQLILLIESGIKCVLQMRTIKDLHEGLNKACEELQKRYMEIIEALRMSVDAKDIYTRGHSDRVSFYAVKIGKALELGEQDLETLRVAGIFHDLGKIGVTDDILLKKEKLSKEEYEEIKKHTLKGAKILSAVTIFKNVVPVVKYHHERVDGKGYPEGLTGEDIPLLSKILSVADAFDSMCTDRLYRRKLGLEEAKKQLVNGSGTQFDVLVADAFLNLLENEKNIIGKMWQ